MSNFDKLLKDFLAKRDVITSKNLGLQHIGIHPDMIAFHEVGILLYNRDNILVKALKSIVACEDHWGGAEMQELAEKALREIGEIE